ncbi:MAG: hypothetical protein V2A53_02080 [bacterium]
MKSATLPSFWTAYKFLNDIIKRSTRKAYRLWAQNPFHPSLHFVTLYSSEEKINRRGRRGHREIKYLL